MENSSTSLFGSKKKLRNISKFFNSHDNPKHLHNPANYFNDNKTKSSISTNSTFSDAYSIISTVSSNDTHVHPVQDLQKQIEDKQKHANIMHSNGDHVSESKHEYSKGKKSLKLKRFFKIDLFNEGETGKAASNYENGNSHYADVHHTNGMIVTHNEGSDLLTYQTLYESDDIKDLMKQYGTPIKKLGEGATGSVSVVKNSNDNRLYAIKLFTFNGNTENRKSMLSFSKKVTAEFCIGSTLHHQNVAEIMDMLQQEDNGTFLLVMEYVPYDFFNVVMSGLLDVHEINCYFKQLCNGMYYVHSMGISHRDLKLDNCVVSEQGVLKIIDFGSSAIFKTDLNDLHFMKTYGVVGSDPYLAPELLDNSTSATTAYYDPRPVDIWSIAIIYYCMVQRKFPWKSPRMIYNSFRLFCSEPEHPKDLIAGPYRLLKVLPKASRELLGSMLEIEPKKRVLLDDIISNDWFKSIESCVVDTKTGKLIGKPHNHTHHLVTEEELNDLLSSEEKTPENSKEKINEHKINEK